MTIAPERLIVRDTIMHVCAAHTNWSTLAPTAQVMLVRRMERSCFETTINSCILDGIDRLFTEQKFVQRYSANCARVMLNLDITSSVGSSDALSKVIIGEINPYKIASMTSCELCPDASKLEREEINLRLRQKSQNKVSRAYKCWKCGGDETIPIEYQGRSSDECSNLSIKCVNCEFVWRK